MRQALWRLHAVYDAELHQNCPRLLEVSSESVRINPAIDLWTDVADFEQAYACLQKSGATDAECFEKMRQAVDPYCGDLLEGWDQDWVLFERVRLTRSLTGALDNMAPDFRVTVVERLSATEPARSRSAARPIEALKFVAGRLER